jgi:FMN-dependent NADH-azoreductase
MPSLLYVEASPRKERSHSIKVADTFLSAYRSANPNDTVDTLDLWSETLPPFNGDTIDAKYALMHGQNPTGGQTAAWAKITENFNRFNAAEKYLFSVPIWNFVEHYVLKHYIDVITQPGLAWAFSPETGYRGLVKGRACAIYSSAGAYHAGSGAEAFDNQKPYFEGWLGFIGITDVARVVCAPMLATPEEIQKAELAAIEDARTLAATF